MISFLPFGESAYKTYWDREISTGDIGWEIAGIVPIGRFAGKGVKLILKTVNGIEITGYTGHAVHRAIQRGVKPASMLDAIKSPLKVGKIVYDNLGRPSQRFIGASAEVVVNPTTGTIISVNPTSSKKTKKLLRDK